MAFDPYSTLPSNFPRPPTPPRSNFLVFPRDLVTPERNFYTELELVQYSNSFGRIIGNVTNTFSEPRVVGGLGFALPLPRKINEVQTLIWEEKSLNPATELGSLISGAITNPVGRVAAALGGNALAAAGAVAGVAINPFLTLMFRQVAFRQHRLDWILAPNSEAESRDIRTIVSMLRKYSLPGVFGPIFTYPYLLLVRFRPSSSFTFKFKPCAIEQVSVDYSAANMPSFFKNGAPTLITLTLILKEIEIWDRNTTNVE